MRGNAVALVIIGVLVAVVVLVNLQSTPNVPQVVDSNSSQKVISEVKVSLEKAMRDSMAELMYKGFSENNEPWFLNGLSVPTSGSVKNSLSSLAEKNLENTLTDLSRSRGYEFSDKQISMKESSGNIVADTKLVASISKDDTIKRFEVETGVELWPEALQMYSKMAEWSQSEMANFSSDVANIVDSLGYCQISQCNCTFSVDAPINTPEKIDERFFASADFKPKLETLMSGKIAKLNELFVGSGISCRYEFKDLLIDRDISYQQVCFGIENGWSKQGVQTLNNDDLKSYWCATQRFRVNDERKFSIWREILVQKFGNTIDANEIVSPSGFVDSQDVVSDSFVTCGDPTTKKGGYTDERISINPKAYVDVAIICENPKVSVAVNDRIQPLSLVANFVAAVKQQCSPSDLRKNIDPDKVEPACLGSSSTPIVKCRVNSDCVPDKLETNLTSDKNPYDGICVSIPNKVTVNCKLECDKNYSCNTPCNSYSCNKNPGRVPQEMLDEGFGICDVNPIIICNSTNPCRPSYCDDSKSACVESPVCPPSTDLKTCGAERECRVSESGATNCVIKEGASSKDCTSLLPLGNCLAYYCKATIKDRYDCVSGNVVCNNVGGVPYACDSSDGSCKPVIIG